jgi:hypothetical protein
LESPQIKYEMKNKPLEEDITDVRKSIGLRLQLNWAPDKEELSWKIDFEIEKDI